jgi:AcrR family transcriptional regulator
LQLRDFLMNLVIKKGYARVSVNDITERAGTDRTTVNLHCKDKDDLFEKSQRWIVDELIALRSRGSGPFHGVSLTFERMARNSEKYLAIFRSEGAAVRTSTLQDYIAQSIMPILEGLLRVRGIRQTAMIEPIAHYLTGAPRPRALVAGVRNAPERRGDERALPPARLPRRRID